jgi:Fe-Mn family superoxide dismutase
MENQNHYPFTLIPLPYAYDALEPYIDKLTMELHHDKHLQTYITNLNNAIKDRPALQNWTLEQLIYFAYQLPKEIKTTVLNNAGGVFNHNFYFKNLEPNKLQKQPQGALLNAIVSKFGSFEDFKTQFKQNALSVFGSGYTALVKTENGELKIVNTKNQDTVLPQNDRLIMLIDVWEHAYYLKNYNLRTNYIDNWFNVVNYQQAEKNYMN